MGKMNSISKCGLTFVIGPILVIFLYLIGIMPATSSSWAFMFIVGPATMFIGLIILVVGSLAKKSSTNSSNSKYEKISKELTRVNYGCPHCELAHKSGVKECPLCGTKFRKDERILRKVNSSYEQAKGFPVGRIYKRLIYECPHCEQADKSGVSNCPVCGAAFR